MSECPTPMFPLPKGNGAETKAAKVHANLGDRTFEQYRRLTYHGRMEVDRQVEAKKRAERTSQSAATLSAGQTH